MKKKALALVLALVMVFTLTGCLAEEIDISFKEDGSGSIRAAVYFSDAFLEQMGQTAEEAFKDDEGTPVKKTIDGNTIKINAASGSTEQDLTIVGSLGDALVIAPKPEMDSDVFVEVNKYDGRFKDVASDAWYAKELERAYNIGIINGTSTTGYDPNGTLTKAQVVVMAARLHSLYTKDNKDLTIITGGQTWYQPYVDYAIQNGIIEKDAFANFDTFASRAEMAYVFAHALPSEAYASSSQKTDFNDVDKTNPYYISVMALYNAGIVNGIGNGNYGPNDTVTRAQAAVFVTRLSTPSYRVA